MNKDAWKKINDKIADIISYIAVGIVSTIIMTVFTLLVMVILGWLKSMIQ